MGRSRGCVALFMGRHEQASTHPGKKPATNQTKDSTKFKLGEPMGFIGITSGRMSENLLRQLHY